MTSRRCVLGYGRAPLVVDAPADAQILTPPVARVTPRSPAEALADPIGAPRLRGRVARGSRVVIAISDATRDEPRDELVRAVLDEIAVDVQVTLAVANGTHAPGPVEGLGLSHEVRARATVYNHDSTAGPHFVELGATARGTRVRLPRIVVEADVVVALGRIRPHYFAGFGAGAKAIFPGLGCREDIRQNHLLKRDPTARLGRVDDNVCRADLEEACRLLPVPKFLLDVVIDDAGGLAAVAGDLEAAFRTGAEICRPLCEVRATALAEVVITSDTLPFAGSLYQASKLLAPAGLLLAPAGVAVLAAECADGTGPLDVVNEGIYNLGIRHFFPSQHTIYLVSSLPPATVSRTYCRYAPSVAAVLDQHRGRSVTLLPRAGNLIPTVSR